MDAESYHFFPVPLSPRISTGASEVCDLANCIEDELHLRARAKHSFKRFSLELLLQLSVIALQTGDMKKFVSDDLEFLNIDRFGEKIVSARADCLQSVHLFALAADNNHLREALLSEHIGQSGESLLGIAWSRRECLIQQHNQGLCSSKDRQALVRSFRQKNFVVLVERPFHLGANFFVVVPTNGNLGFIYLRAHEVLLLRFSAASIRASRPVEPTARSIAGLKYTLPRKTVRIALINSSTASAS